MDAAAKKVLTTTALVVGGIPLVAYPAIIFADVMALAAAGGHFRFPTTPSEWLNAYLIIGATVYPAVWLIALARSIVLMRRGREATALRTSLVPLAFLATLPLAFLVSQAAAR